MQNRDLVYVYGYQKHNFAQFYGSYLENLCIFTDPKYNLLSDNALFRGLLLKQLYIYGYVFENVVLLQVSRSRFHKIAPFTVTLRARILHLPVYIKG